jgi:hypothetical protein
VFVEGENTEGDWEMEAAGTAGAGVEVEHAISLVEVGDVGVAEEDDGEAGGGGVEVDGVEVVKEVDVAAFEEKDLGFREVGAGAHLVDVASDCGDGSNLGEVVEDGDCADVSEVEDAVNTGEYGKDFGTEEAVGIAEDADLHGGSSTFGGFENRLLLYLCG